MCDKMYLSNTYLRDHKQSAHLKEILYKCDICDHSTHSRRGLIKHVKKLHSSIMKCGKCEKKFTYKKDLTLHILTQH